MQQFQNSTFYFHMVFVLHQEQIVMLIPVVSWLQGRARLFHQTIALLHEVLSLDTVGNICILQKDFLPVTFFEQSWSTVFETSFKEFYELCFSKKSFLDKLHFFNKVGIQFLKLL